MVFITDNADCNSGLECIQSSGKCMDIDECSTTVGVGLVYCGQNAMCTNTIGSFNCTCNEGFENHVANIGCSDIDECLQNPAPGCAKRTKCTNTIGKTYSILLVS